MVTPLSSSTPVTNAKAVKVLDVPIRDLENVTIRVKDYDAVIMSFGSSAGITCEAGEGLVISHQDFSDGLKKAGEFISIYAVAVNVGETANIEVMGWLK